MTRSEPAGDAGDPEPGEADDAGDFEDDRDALEEPRGGVNGGPVNAFSLPPGADPAIDWGVRAHLPPDGSPRIIERHLVVPPELAGLRLDHFVKTQNQPPAPPRGP